MLSIFRHAAASVALALLAAPLAAQPAAVRTPASAAGPSILFVGNSFTYGAYSPVRGYRANTVTDLNGTGIGGVPALFKAFAEQAGLAYRVSLETQGGKDLAFHLAERRALIDRPWDVVILQDLSTFDRERPGDVALHVAHVRPIAAMLAARNPRARILLEATWSRADQTYLKTGHWYGKPIERMALDLRAGSDAAARAAPAVAGVLPVGQAFNRAFAAGVADPDPYDGIAFGQVDLWTHDQFHGSTHGYYLAALVIFAEVTGRDPRTLGEKEQAAADLGIAPRVAARLQQVAFDEVAANRDRK